MTQLTSILEIIGTIAFSISGAMVAIRKNMDLLGIVVLGLVTATGGGLIRDIITGQIPPKVFINSSSAAIAALVAFITFFVIKYSKRILKYKKIFDNILLISDAVGLGVFTVTGIYSVSLRLGTENGFLLVFVGVITGVGGGILRDIMAGDIPYVFVKHIYATASLLGALSYMFLFRITDLKIAMLISILLVLLIRIAAAYLKLNLPKINMDIDSSNE